MKITAEFNSNEELLSFINTFGGKNIISVQQGVQAPVSTDKKEDVAKTIVETVPTKNIVENPEEKKDTTPKVNAEIVSEGPPDAESIEAESNPVGQSEPPKEESKPEITKEMVRAKFNEIIKAGKQKEAKELVAKFGASKLPDVDPKHYEALLKEAEALL
jgi:hypothetical protein